MFDDATTLAAQAKQAALQEGMKYISRSEAVTLAAAETTATATIFAALVQADLSEQMRRLREIHDHAGT